LSEQSDSRITPEIVSAFSWKFRWGKGVVVTNLKFIASVVKIYCWWQKIFAFVEVFYC